MSRIVRSLSYQQSVVDYPNELEETRDYPQRWHNALCRHFWVPTTTTSPLISPISMSMEAKTVSSDMKDMDVTAEPRWGLIRSRSDSPDEGFHSRKAHQRPSGPVVLQSPSDPVTQRFSFTSLTPIGFNSGFSDRYADDLPADRWYIHTYPDWPPVWTHLVTSLTGLPRRLATWPTPIMNGDVVARTLRAALIINENLCDDRSTLFSVCSRPY
jgi:hypothetical protein